ncbi:MAG: 50S ribosomal protein L23 [Oscillospiraceae bacterium]|jgi:large subunit ribosomal protein L23|nr:50S ribosomal protein L23 [Oscillospiraceae bacterium]
MKARSVYDVIRSPIVTERSMQDVNDKKYVFKVDRHANKFEIKAAVEKIFPGTKVDKVNTMIVPGKKKRSGRYPAGYTGEWKKAIVKLTKSSKTIEFFEGMV